MVTPVALAQDAPEKAEGKAEAPKQKVLGLRIEGLELASKDREDLFKVVQQRLKAYPTIELVRPPDEELTDLMIDLGCLDIDVECLTKVGGKRMSDQVFYAQVDVVDAGFQLTVRLIDVTKGSAKRDQKATVSTKADLTTALEREIVAAFGKAPPPPPKDGRLMIQSAPGAKIFIDGALVGSGRVKLVKPPGLYVVRVEKQGYEPALFRVDLQAGKTAKKIAELKAIPVAKPEPKPIVDVAQAPLEEAASPEFYETWWFWTAVGAVVVSATTVGIVVGSGGGENVSTGDLQISVDPSAAWRDYATRLGGAR